MKKINKCGLLAMFMVLVALFATSCSDDDNGGQGDPLPEGTQVKAVIVNQGLLTKGNASLSTLMKDGTVNNDVFRTVNNRPLGDVAQSMMYKDGKYFVVLNNSKKIEVVDAKTFKSLETIAFKEDVNPRYMVSINEKEAVLSDMNKQLILINTETYQVVKSIETGGFAVEQMLCVGGKLFCCSTGSGIYVYNTNDLNTPRKIATEYAPFETTGLVQNTSDKIWAFCGGLNDDYEKETVFYGIDPVTEKVTDTIVIPADIQVSYYPRTAGNAKTNKIYFDGSQDSKTYAYEFNPAKGSIEPYVELSGLGMIYGMNVSSDGNVFIADCLDYSGQRAYLREYRTDGSFFSYKVGIYPGFIHFTENNQ